MSKKLFLILAVFILLILFSGSSLEVYAQGLSEEHGKSTDSEQVRNGPGGCTTKGECRAYCDEKDNRRECIVYGINHGLLTKEEGRKALRFIQGGPESCNTVDSCRSACQKNENREKCIDFAHETGAISLQKAQAQRALLKGGPNGCRSSDECRKACDNPANSRTCIEFAKEAGLIREDQANRLTELIDKKLLSIDEQFDKRNDEHAVIEEGEKYDKDKAIKAIMSNGGPGNCGDFDACHAFCDDESNAEVCFEYAREHGFMDQEDIRRAKEFVQREGPGGCKGQECRRYCSDKNNRDECFEFAKKHDMISEKKAKHIEKSKMVIEAIEHKGGPLGCREEKECSRVCSNPSNADVCFKFAEDHQIFDDVELRQKRDEIERFRNEFDKHRIDESEQRKLDELKRHREERFDNPEHLLDEVKEGEFRPAETQSFKKEPIKEEYNGERFEEFQDYQENIIREFEYQFEGETFHDPTLAHPKDIIEHSASPDVLVTPHNDNTDDQSSEYNKFDGSYENFIPESDFDGTDSFHRDFYDQQFDSTHLKEQGSSSGLGGFIGSIILNFFR